MIIVKLSGGLGNQLFQYAYGRSMSLKNKVELKLDVTPLNDTTFKKEYTKRELELFAFNIKATIAAENELKPYKANKLKKFWNFFLFQVPVNIDRLYIREPSFSFFRRALNLPRNAYLDGYWQSEKYFIDYHNELLKELSPLNPLSEESSKIAELIKREKSVSVHVRRSDYLSVANKNIYEICDQQYYHSAIEYISRSVTNPVFFIFSDEPEWFKENIKTTFTVFYVEHNKGSNSHEDMWLMSLCKHNIIANSSFSWWGAWLNTNKNKTVIAPKKWFRNNLKNTQDLIPEGWIKI